MKPILTTMLTAHKVILINHTATPSATGQRETTTFWLENLDTYGLPSGTILAQYNTPEIAYLLEPWVLNMIEQGLINTQGDYQSTHIQRITFLGLPTTTTAIIRVSFSTQPYTPTTMPQATSRRYSDTMNAFRTYGIVRTALAQHLQVAPDYYGSPRNPAENEHHQLINELIDSALELAGWTYHQGASKKLVAHIAHISPTYNLVKALFAHLVNFVITYRTIGGSAHEINPDHNLNHRDHFAETLNEAIYTMITHVVYDTNSQTACDHQWKRLFNRGDIAIQHPRNLACAQCGITSTYTGRPHKYLTDYELIDIILPLSS